MRPAPLVRLKRVSGWLCGMAEGSVPQLPLRKHKTPLPAMCTQRLKADPSRAMPPGLITHCHDVVPRAAGNVHRVPEGRGGREVTVSLDMKAPTPDDTPAWSNILPRLQALA